MSKLYEDVKKQGTQIDDLQKKVTDHGTRIETLETQAMATPPAQVASVPPEVKVVIPDEIARESDIDKAVTKIIGSCKNGETQSSQPISVTVSPLDALEKVKFEKTTQKAVKDEIAETEKKVVENNSILIRMEKKLNRADNETTLRRKLYLFIGGYAIYTVILIIACVALFRQSDQLEHLKRVEWLYRWSRIGRKDAEDYQDFERRMLDGKKEEREGMNTKIFNMERNAPQFLYFRPTDDWTPEPPQPPTVEEAEQPKAQADNKVKPLPHEQRSRLTPGEIKAIKDMRASPNIPEEAKPELPEGYE